MGIMRLRKGDFVEVLSKKEAPTGSWHCAEVISGNGHTYKVKYVRFRWTNEENDAFTERVPRKSLRPSPPPVGEVDDWVPGDHVEVYHNMCWKTATVVKYLDQHVFLVRLLGDSREFEVHRSYLRVRQSWEDGKWFLVGKGACATPAKINANTFSRQIFGKVLKRASPVSLTDLERDSNSSQRSGVTETNKSQKKLKRRSSEHPSPLTGKVDGYIYPQETLGENSVHAMLDVAKNSFSATNLDIVESNDFDYTLTNSVASSVGSCSIDDTIENKIRNDKGTFYSEKNEELFEHRLDLLLYRSALKALFASGPLSWEDELKMVELMDALHISNEEHLAEIKDLISTDTRITAC